MKYVLYQLGVWCVYIRTVRDVGICHFRCMPFVYAMDAAPYVGDEFKLHTHVTCKLGYFQREIAKWIYSELEKLTIKQVRK